MSLLSNAADLFFRGFSQTSINLYVKIKALFNGNQLNLSSFFWGGSDTPDQIRVML